MAIYVTKTQYDTYETACFCGGGCVLNASTLTQTYGSKSRTQNLCWYELASLAAALATGSLVFVCSPGLQPQHWDAKSPW